MQLRPAFPVDTVGGACFITLSSTIPEGEQVIDLDRDLEDMPAWGRLCILPDAVRLMCAALDWDVDPDKQRRIREQKATIAQLRAEREQLLAALSAVVLTAKDAGIDIDFVNGEPVAT